MAVIATGETGLPSFMAGGDGLCISCGHCQALCPVEAITVEDPRLSDRTYPLQGVKPSKEELGEYLRSRRSIRSYKEAPVERIVIEELMDVVRYAPTARNSQTVRWLMILDTKELRRLTGLAIDWIRHMASSQTPTSVINFKGLVEAWDAGSDPICRKAPHLIVAYGHKESPFARNDAFIALSHLDVAAPAFGLGTCWGGFFQAALVNWAPLRSELNLPADCIPHFAMMLGYPAVQYHRIPRRNPLSLTWR
jgi:nitroreductase